MSDVGFPSSPSGGHPSDPSAPGTLLQLVRDIPSEFNNILQDEVICLCYCVKIKRQDGTVLGFTTHDVNVILDGVTYQALSAVKMSNIRQEASGNPDNLDVIGVVSSDSITETDLRAGRYDNATVEVRICDWSNTAIGASLPLVGNIGDVTISDGTYTAAVRSLMQRFQQQVGELRSPTCRVFQLGDARCKFNLAGNTVDGNPARSNVVTTAIDDPTILHVSGGVTKVGYYNEGDLLATSGINTGYKREVKLHSDSNTMSSAVVNSSGMPTGNLSYKRPLNFTNSVTLTLAVPAGTWEMASLLVTSAWTLRNSGNPGTDILTFQFPPGQANDQVLVTNSGNGTINTDVDLGDTLLAQINAAAGGTMSIGLRHTTQSESGATPYFNLSVSVLQLVLLGSGSGSSSRLVLHEAFPFPVSIGDTFQATTGCNRLSGTCTQKFGNIVNFRGEPNMPGTERLLQRGRPPQ